MDSLASLAKAWLLGLVPWRWLLQRLLGLYSLSFLLFLAMGPSTLPVSFSLLYLTLHAVFLLNNSRTAYGVYQAYSGCSSGPSSLVSSCDLQSLDSENLDEKTLDASSSVTLDLEGHIGDSSQTDWPAAPGSVPPTAAQIVPPLKGVKHMILIPNYKESMETLTETLDILASHEGALSCYKIVLAMEESEAQALVKAKTLLRMYSDHFWRITFTLHPQGIPGEIRGKSSNVNWAAKQAALPYINTPSESLFILTVMDADTCFAQDYFAWVTRLYLSHPPQKRRTLMFAPFTVFDRNAHHVSPLVRVADMLWSAGVMSNLYPSSPIKFPCSAYSLSLTLAHAVDYWDTDPTAMGEDMHMFLKCFFKTQGQLSVQTIFSPASQCNVEGPNGSWYEGLQARYTQAKRHMWGCLDLAYTLRQTLFGLLEPGKDAPEHPGEPLLDYRLVPLQRPKNQVFALPMDKLATLYHRLLEAHLLLGHMFFLVIGCTLFIPGQGSPFPTLTQTWWDWSSGSQDAHPYLAMALWLGGWIRFLAILPFFATLYYYEKYHQWASSDRWKASLRQSVSPGLTALDSALALGKRPTLISTRSKAQLLDWICLPLTGVLFLGAPQLHAHLMQLLTDKLDYVVAIKPTLDVPRPVSDGILLHQTRAGHYSPPLMLRSSDLEVHVVDEGDDILSGEGPVDRLSTPSSSLSLESSSSQPPSLRPSSSTTTTASTLTNNSLLMGHPHPSSSSTALPGYNPGHSGLLSSANSSTLSLNPTAASSYQNLAQLHHIVHILPGVSTTQQQILEHAGKSNTLQNSSSNRGDSGFFEYDEKRRSRLSLQKQMAHSQELHQPQPQEGEEEQQGQHPKPPLDEKSQHRSRSTSPASRTGGFMMGLPLEDESTGPDFKWSPVTTH